MSNLFEKHNPLKVYLAVRFASALLFSVIVTVNLVYEATVVGLNPLQLVLVGTVLETVSFLFEVPTGYLADRFGRKRTLLLGTVFLALSWAATWFAHGFPAFTVVFVLMSASFSCFSWSYLYLL